MDLKLILLLTTYVVISQAYFEFPEFPEFPKMVFPKFRPIVFPKIEFSGPTDISMRHFKPRPGQNFQGISVHSVMTPVGYTAATVVTNNNGKVKEYKWRHPPPKPMRSSFSFPDEKQQEPTLKKEKNEKNVSPIKYQMPIRKQKQQEVTIKKEINQSSDSPVKFKMSMSAQKLREPPVKKEKIQNSDSPMKFQMPIPEHKEKKPHAKRYNYQIREHKSAVDKDNDEWPFLQIEEFKPIKMPPMDMDFQMPEFQMPEFKMPTIEMPKPLDVDELRTYKPEENEQFQAQAVSTFSSSSNINGVENSQGGVSKMVNDNGHAETETLLFST